MSEIILLLLLVPPIVLGIISARKLMFLMLLSGGIPITLFMPDVRFLQFMGGGFGPQAIYLFVIVLAVFVAFIFKFDFLFREIVRYKAILLFLLFCGISFVWTSDIVYGVRMFIKLLSPFLFFVAMQAFLRGREDLKIAEKLIFICGLIVLSIALLNNLTNGMLAHDQDNMQWVYKNILTAPYMSPANFSFFMGSVAILALGNYLTTRKLGFLFLYVIFSVAVFWAFTRISMAGLVVASAISFFLLTRSIMLKILIPVVLVSLFVMAVFSVSSLRERMFMDSSLDFTAVIADPDKAESMLHTSGRTFLWKEARKNLFDKSPLIGEGVGATDYWLDKQIPPSRLHSEYLHLACDVGLVGLALYILALLSLFVRLLSLRNKSQNKVVKQYAVIAISSLAFYAITLATDNSLNYVSEFGLYVFSFIAFAVIAARENRNNEQKIVSGKPPFANSKGVSVNV